MGLAAEAEIWQAEVGGQGRELGGVVMGRESAASEGGHNAFVRGAVVGCKTS